MEFIWYKYRHNNRSCKGEIFKFHPRNFYVTVARGLNKKMAENISANDLVFARYILFDY
jgi:hypothetical protein